MKLARAAAFAAMLAIAAPAFAQDEPVCMQTIPISAALIAEADQYEWRGAEARGQTPAFLIGHLSPTRVDQELADGAYGGAVFVRDAAGAWRAFVPSPTESVVGAFTTDAGAALFVTQVQSEGPGQSWTIVRDAFANGACATVPFPEELNQPTWAMEYVELSDLDIKANGRGELLGTARIERGGRELSWHYLWRTRDGGATWTGPTRLRAMRLPKAGVYDELEEAPATGALVELLASFAAAR